jgi:hypothetical protein
MKDRRDFRTRVQAVNMELWHSYRDKLAEGFQPGEWTAANPMTAFDALELACDMLDKVLAGEPDDRIEGWLNEYRDGKLVNP